MTLVGSPTWDDEVSAGSRFHQYMESTECILAKLAIRDDAFIQSILAGNDASSITLSELDPKTHALARVAALIALDAPTPSYMWAVESAREAGLTDREIVGSLVARAARGRRHPRGLRRAQARPRARLRRRPGAGGLGALFA
jgi:hypothetical protein